MKELQCFQQKCLTHVIEVVTPGIVVVLGTCDDVGDMEAVVVTKNIQ